MSAAGSTLVGHARVRGGGGDDIIEIKMLNSRSDSLDVDGGDGLDTLNVDDTGDATPNSGVLTATTLTGLGMGVGITYGAVEVLNISLGAAATPSTSRPRPPGRPRRSTAAMATT